MQPAASSRRAGPPDEAKNSVHFAPGKGGILNSNCNYFLSIERALPISTDQPALTLIGQRIFQRNQRQQG